MYQHIISDTNKKFKSKLLNIKAQHGRQPQKNKIKKNKKHPYDLLGVNLLSTLFMFSGTLFNECPADPFLPKIILFHALLTCPPLVLSYSCWNWKRLNFKRGHDERKKQRAAAVASAYTALLAALHIAGL
jgi:hypothetical protein